MKHNQPVYWTNTSELLAAVFDVNRTALEMAMQKFKRRGDLDAPLFYSNQTAKAIQSEAKKKDDSSR